MVVTKTENSADRASGMSGVGGSVDWMLPTLVVFLASFLVFLVQPMIAKYALPLFGGSASVWVVAVLCFQVLLVGGYLYAHWLSRLSFLRQVVVHGMVLVGVVGLQVLVSLNWEAYVLPRFEVFQPYLDRPWLAGAMLVVVSVGWLYLMLTTTSSLVQTWWAKAMPGKSPYWLYVVSNIGSLGALVSYPVLVEPSWGLKFQGNLWFVSFLVYVGLLGVYGLWVGRRLGWREKKKRVARIKKLRVGDWKDYLVWGGLALLPSAMMLAVTNHLTQGVAAGPFIWVLTLGVYLLSFAVAFEDVVDLVRPWVLSLVLVLVLGAILASSVLGVSVLGAGSYFVYWLVCLFWVCLLVHHWLYGLRPEPSGLTGYYLMVAIGGALGGVLVGVVAPVVFDYFWEVDLSLVAVVVLVTWLLVKKRESRRWVWLLAGLVMVVLVVTGVKKVMDRSGMIYANRNFYGALAVSEVGGVVKLSHGSIVHGAQYKASERRREPLTYYTEGSGLGMLFKARNRIGDKEGGGLRVGVAGLGAGTVSAYCLPGDELVYYEIDPEVVEVAKKYFSYLELCEDTKVVVGDARLSMEREVEDGGGGEYDVLVLDAFSGDSVPTHLLTKEAFEVYLQLLAPRGVLAVNISNAYLDLKSPLKGVAKELGLEVWLVKNSSLTDDYSVLPSDWVLMSRDGGVFEDEVFGGGKPESSEVVNLRDDDGVGERLWTDQYSAVWEVLR